MNYYEDTGETRKSWDHAHETHPCLITDLAELKGEAPEGYLEGCNEYLSVFAAPIWVDGGDKKVMACLHCGEHMTGMLAGLLGRGGFEWGLAHGEGHCRNCGWPARAYHFAKNSKGEELFTLRPYILQYLPDYEAEANARRDEQALVK